MEAFKKVFGRVNNVIIGMIHVRALPGSPLNTMNIDDITNIALNETKIYQAADVDGVLVENMHDIPYIRPCQLGPETVANMTRVCYEIKKLAGNMPCGIQILAACNKEAIAVASAAGFQFIRAEGFIFSHVADEGLIDACAGSLLRYRKTIGAEHIQIYTDIKKKHSSHAITADLSLLSTGHAAQFFLSDGIVLTGEATGCPADVDDLKAVKSAMRIPTLIGSGVNLHNFHRYTSANGLIIGSHFKKKEKWDQELDEENILAFMKQVKKRR